MDGPNGSYLRGGGDEGALDAVSIAAAEYKNEVITEAVRTRYLELIRQRASDLSLDPTAVPRARGGGAA